MGKITLNKLNDVSSVQSSRQSDLKKTDEKTSVSDSSGTGKVFENDRLQLSDQASKVGKLVDQIKELPDVRADKVNDLREQISSGDYNPSSEDIADAILKQESE